MKLRRLTCQEVGVNGEQFDELVGAGPKHDGPTDASSSVLLPEAPELTPPLVKATATCRGPVVPRPPRLDED